MEHLQPYIWVVPILFQKDTCSDLVLSKVLSQQTFVGLQDVFKTSSRHAFKTSSTRLQCSNFLSSKTSSRRLQDLLQIRLEDILEDKKLLRWRRLEDMCWRCVENISWRLLEDISWKCLEDILETNKMFTGDICI